MAADPELAGIGVTVATIRTSPVDWLRQAERLAGAGFATVWAWDHFVGRGDPTVPVVEAWTALTAAAARDDHLRVGTFIANVMNRHPSVLARMAGTLQELTGGRLTLGLGIGANESEHAAYGIDFPPPKERAEHLEEAILILRGLWSGGPFTFAGRHFQLADAYAHPVIEPRPQILVGAGSPAGIRIAARLGDGWAAEEPLYMALNELYAEALTGQGRQRRDQRVVVSFGGERRRDATILGTRWVEEPRAALEEWRAKGADEATVVVRTDEEADALVRAAERGR